MQCMTLTGSLGRDAELKTTQGGDSILSFSVGSSQGYGDKKTTNWFRCTVWGKRGASIAQYLAKGTKVTVQGELTIGEYDGKPQFEIRVNEVDWVRNERANTGNGGGGYDAPKVGRERDAIDDLDDDVPFVSCDPRHERRAR